VSDTNSSQNQDDQNASENTDTSSEVESLKTQIEKLKNDYLYLRAEFDNYKRNVIKERQELIKFGSERLLVDVLGVLDNFERALEIKISAENFPTFAKGMEMTYQELKAALAKFGISEVPAQGLPFDPNIHEALSSEETEEVKPGHISRVFKKPYKLHDKLVRPGQVIVAKEPVKN